MRAWLALAVACALSGCGDQPRPCLLEEYPEVDSTCRDSMRVAARYTDEYRPTQAEVDDRGDLLATARTADAGLDFVHDQYIPMDEIVVSTTIGAVQSGWESGELLTGDPDVDTILVSSGALSVQKTSEHLFRLAFSTPVNIERIIGAVSEVDGFAAEASTGSMDGGEILLPGPNLVRFMYGWGDCFVGCPYDHYWLVEVVGATASVLEEGGDPLPPVWPPEGP